jgi:hypothetical protein
MHDIDRDSLIYKKAKKTKKKHHDPSSDHGFPDNHDHDHDHDSHNEYDHGHDHDHDSYDDNDHSHGHEHGSHDDHDHNHDHDHTSHNGHEHDIPHGHDHKHDEEFYEEHDGDLHVHQHDREVFGDRSLGDRAFAHLHDHKHIFYHQHHHTHHPEHTSVIHKVFKDPVRDWFGLGFMVMLITAGYYKWLPGHLSDGMLVCAAVIGIFPILKNALFECITRRALCLELIIGIFLVAGLFMGKFLVVSLAAVFLLAGSFMKLSFSWRNE